MTCLVTHGLLLSLNVSAMAADTEFAPRRHVNQLVETVGNGIRKIALYRDIALRAVENAFAVQADCQAELLKALQLGDGDLIAAAKKNVRSSATDAENAIRMTERILLCAERATVSARLAAAEAAHVDEEASARRIKLLPHARSRRNVTMP